MKKKTKSEPMVNIGVSEGAVATARGAIMEILNCEKSGDDAKVAAFDALKHLCEVNNVTIQNCNFESK